jgi:dihydropteroate synthase
MNLLVFEFYLQFLVAKAVKDVTPLRDGSEMAKVIVEYQVQVILMFSKTAHHPQSHNNQITRICWTPSRVFSENV